MTYLKTFESFTLSEKPIHISKVDEEVEVKKEEEKADEGEK
jgi:hypothetical protein